MSLSIQSANIRIENFFKMSQIICRFCLTSQVVFADTKLALKSFYQNLIWETGKMKRIDVKENIATAIMKRQNCDAKTWCIVWRENQIQCVPRRCVVESIMGTAQPTMVFDFKFGTITEADCINGLTATQWESIFTKVSLFLNARGMLS